jgi:hypothetical protein
LKIKRSEYSGFSINNHSITNQQLFLQRRRPSSQSSLLGYAPERGKDERPGTGGASRDTSAILAAS